MHARDEDATYEQIAERLRADIAAGRYAPGERMPPERALAERFGVQRHTVRRGLQLLATEGLVHPRLRKGVFVTEDLVADWDLSADPAPAAAEVGTAEPEDEINGVRLAELLDFGGSELAIRRVSVVTVGSHPAAILADYIPYETARNTPLMHKAPADPAAAISGADDSEQSFRVRTVTLAEAARLKVPATAPVLDVVKRCGPARGGRRPLLRHRVYRTGPRVTFTP